MAKVVLGIGTSHGPMLVTETETWGGRVPADKVNMHAWKGGSWSFDDLVKARSGEGLAEQATKSVWRGAPIERRRPGRSRGGLTMILKPLNRRTVLRGMLATGAAVALPLPLLDGMLNGNGTALAQTGELLAPLYVTWFFGNGVLPGRWKPSTTGAGSEWALSSQLEPLQALKSYLTVISGLEGKLVVSGNEHPSGSAAATTGAPLNGDAVRAPSIDQIVADLIF